MPISKDPKDWTALIVDDEPDNVGVARKVLNYGGAKVYVARNGVEGLALLEDVRPTFVLLDLSMPEMDGWEMFRLMKADDSLASIPVIALTAHAMAGDKEKVIETGFNGYIAKPFRINSFVAEIQKCLDEYEA
ncbi:MAG: response regulator [Anaerolineae bacterium]|jgi:two-component system cell cycle response regulator DivK